MADGEIVFNITGDNSDLKSTLKDTTRDIDNETGKWTKSAEDSSGNIESSFSSMLTKLGGMFAAAKIGQYILDFAKESIGLASQLEEVQNVVDQVFGEGADVIDQWAATAGDAFGLTRIQAKQFTGTMGSILKGMGVGEEDVLQMSMSLAGLAADMASFYNLDFEDAFNKLRAGITGQTEPLTSLGIVMTEANLEAFRLAQGIDTAYSAMTSSEKAELRYAYIMEQTKDAQGDFARTSDGFANSVRQLETLLTELKLTIGEALIGPVTEALGYVKQLFEYVMNPSKSLMEQFDDINEETAEFVAETEHSATESRDLVRILTELGDPTLMAGLASGTENLNEKQKQWLETCRQLVGIIPELSDVIDVETGAIKGGTQSVNDYIDAWETRRKQEAAEKAIAQKQAALEKQYGNIQQMEIELAIATKKAENARSDFEAMGGQERYDYLQQLSWSDTSEEEAAEWEELSKAYDKMYEYEDERYKLAKEYGEKKADYDAAEEELKEYTAAALEWAGVLSNDAETAQAGAENVTAAVATGINAQAPAVQQAVDHVNGILGQLGNVGGTSLFSGFNIGGPILNGSHASGLDYVPFDNYLASLHEGESILTAEEAKVWRNFKNGQVSGRNSIDYGRMAGAIWDSAPQMGGGNVYLDGQTVGRVISARQADSYRTLQRSGWQA